MILRTAVTGTILALALSGAADGRGAKECAVTRILADGRVVRSVAPAGAAESVSVRSGNGAASASAHSRSRGSASASSSSSASSGGGRHASHATSSYTDEEGRRVTVTRDDNGCAIEIDERDS